MNDPRFVVFVAAFMAEKYIARALNSALYQEYPHFRIVCVVDASPDGTLINAKQTLDLCPTVQSELIMNPAHQTFLANISMVAAKCRPEEILVELDGDDQFSHRFVLNRLAEEYRNPDVWLTYGSYEYDFESRNPDPQASPRGITVPISPENHTRKDGWKASHLRSFYVWLFNQIKIDDLKFMGEWIDGAADHALMFPMIEMGGPKHCKYIDEILYLYNATNPLNEHKVKPGIARMMASYLKKQKPYWPLPDKP